MREIKFRAWGKKKRIMVSWSRIMEEDSSNLADYFTNESGEGVLMQYTGLKDKNSREVYEGDVVRLPEHNYQSEYEPVGVGLEVYMNWDRWHLRFGPGDFPSAGDVYDDDVDWKEVEVIGNIYEHPHLLEVI